MQKTLNKHRPTLLYYRVKTSQKRHLLLGLATPTPTDGLVLVLVVPLTLFAFGALMVFRYMVDGGGDVGTDVNIVDPMLPRLVEMLNEVNTHRRNFMHQFLQEPSMAQNMMQLLNTNHDMFAANHPVLQRDYEIIKTITERIMAQYQELASYQFAEAATRFESLIADLDDVADQLERVISNLDPNYDFGSDTDSEDIQRAVEEMAGRSNNNERGGEDSPSN